MEWWMDTIYTFHMTFYKMTITPMDFVVIIGLPLEGRSVVFDDQLRLLHQSDVHPPSEFNPFAEVEDLDRDQGGALARRQQHDKHVRRGSDFEASDMAVVISKPEHGSSASFSFISERMRREAQGMLETHLVPIADYNEVCQLYEAAHLKLAMTRLSDESHLFGGENTKARVISVILDHLTRGRPSGKMQKRCIARALCVRKSEVFGAKCTASSLAVNSAPAS
ncbi:hypothetical protein JCGZ_24132 [Jatropha curcas]|uniref:Uncharacterized protein n=1 Tax=Jatropha curcas TaxID=180498 RepID=A0A067LHJ8_JATCU|nr:hypothetical protein JCGZ_24132 [Jatropha curcas]